MKNVIVAVVLASGAAWAESEWEKKVNAFRGQAEAQRKKLGLKGNEKQATPELAFVATPGPATDGQVVICPGQSVDVKLKTNLPAGSLFLATLDDITISKEKLDQGVWSATLTAKASAPPRTFDVRGVHATSAREASIGSFLLGCKHTLVTETDGAKLALKLDFTTGRRTTESSGDWVKGGKALGTSKYQVTIAPEGLRSVRVDSMEDQQAQMNAMTKSLDSPERKAAQKKLEAAMKKMEPCTKLPPAKMQPCMQAVQGDIEAASAEMKRVSEQADAAGAPAFGCSDLDLSYDGPATLSGRARRCPGRQSNDEVPAKATITAP